MIVYDVRTSGLIERVLFDGLSLVSPTLSSTVNGAVPYADSVGEVAHSLRIYKGKIFLLVSSDISPFVLLYLVVGPRDGTKFKSDPF